MEMIFRIIAVCMLASVLAMPLKKNSPEMGILLVVAVCVSVLILLSDTLRDICAFLEQLTDWGGISADLFVPLLKTLGIAIISRLGTDLCRDAGQTAMAGLVEMAASFGVIWVAMPLFRAVWEMLQTML